MLSAALSRTQLFPPFVVLSKTPLPPAAHASSCSCIIALELELELEMEMDHITSPSHYGITHSLIDWVYCIRLLTANCNSSCLVPLLLNYPVQLPFTTPELPVSGSRHQESQNPGSALAPPRSLQLSMHGNRLLLHWAARTSISKEEKTAARVSVVVSSQDMLRIKGHPFCKR
jgi:hypothetical protein